MHQVEHKYGYACGVCYVLLKLKDWGEREVGAVPLAPYACDISFFLDEQVRMVRFHRISC